MNEYAAECFEIKKLCGKYGYGDVMEWVSALWRHENRRKGYPESGCFVPTCPSFIKDDCRFPKQQMLYDTLVNEILGEPKGVKDDGKIH